MHKVSQHMQNTTAQHQQRREKSHMQPLPAQWLQDSTAKQRRPEPLRARANFPPQWNLPLPEKTPCFVQILTIKSHPRCSTSNAIRQDWLAKDNQNRKTGEQVPFDKPGRSHSTAICTDLIAQRNRIATRYNTSLRCTSSNAQSVSTHAKHNSTASTKKRKKSPATTARAVVARFHGKAATPGTVACESQLFSATKPPFTRKNMQILT